MDTYQIKEVGFRYRTDFLYSTPSFLSGSGSVLNLAGNYFRFNRSSTDIEADSLAIQNDFHMIGQDLRDTIDRVLLSEHKQLQEH